MIFARDNQASMANLYGTTLATGSTVKDVEQWPDRIKKVTTADIQEVAAKYLCRRPFRHRLPAALRPGAELT